MNYKEYKIRKVRKNQDIKMSNMKEIGEKKENNFVLLDKVL
jgi:hypothetical protein